MCMRDISHGRVQVWTTIMIEGSASAFLPSHQNPCELKGLFTAVGPSHTHNRCQTCPA